MFFFRDYFSLAASADGHVSQLGRDDYRMHCSSKTTFRDTLCSESSDERRKTSKVRT